MKNHNRFVVFLCFFPLLGCEVAAPPTQAISVSGQAIKNEGSYNKVLKGALGFSFGVIDTPVLKEKGFNETINPRYYSDVGKWVSNSYNDKFFNLNVEIVVSPISNLVKSIEGNRFYGKKKYINHFRSCMDDYRAIITQLKSKYPTLVSASDLNIFRQNEYSSSWFHEGVTRYQYTNAKKYLGRSVVVLCSIQTWNEKT